MNVGLLLDTGPLVAILDGRDGLTADQVVELARAIARAPTFRLDENDEPVRRLLAKYRSVPMSFADACLVRMSELHAGARVATFDGDFRVYRRHGRQRGADRVAGPVIRGM